MKRFLVCVLALAGLLLAGGCQREREDTSGQPVDVSFQIGMDIATKALGNGGQALRLTLRTYDQQGNFVRESTADREVGETGWTITQSIVPGAYSFCFWASSPDSDAYSFDGQYLAVDYSKMKPNSDQDDAFWAVLAGKEVTAGFTEPVTLTRPLAQVSLCSKDENIDLGEEDLDDADRFVSSLTLTGANGGGLPTRMNLLDGSTDILQAEVAFLDASLTELEVSQTNGTALAFAYVLVPAAGLTLSEVTYSATLKRTTPETDLASGTAADVPLARNKRTLLLYSPPAAPAMEAVDLGLPSGLLWASFNLGATNPEEFGDYYAWGETETHYSSLNPLTWKVGMEDGYAWSNYQFGSSDDGPFSKYNTTDQLTVLETGPNGDDVASKVLGGSWRMPTYNEWGVLMNYCKWEWKTTADGYACNGYLVSGNGNSIFLPAAGQFVGTDYQYSGSKGYYGTSSFNPDDECDCYFICLKLDEIQLVVSSRYKGVSIRAVKD